MTDYKKYINELRKCAKEHENDITPFAHIRVSDLCRDTANLLEDLEQQPCEDAISRADAVKVASGYCHPSNIAKELAKLPPVTPRPKTGHWIYDKRIENWKCSECGYISKIIGYVGCAEFMAKHFKFCNHCGVRMIDPQESEDKE